MKPVQIDERLAVCGQISPQDISGLAQAGYTTIVNNRPDGEGFLQPTASAIADAAGKAGLRSAHLPVRGPDITEQLVRDFQKTLAESAGPVVAFCRSGTRSLTLWAIGEVLDGRMAKADLMQFGARHGFDLSGGVAWLATHGR
ncbi:MAG: TIGR01244 family sulfur transferase [Pseudaminobacter sp.]